MEHAHQWRLLSAGGRGQNRRGTGKERANSHRPDVAAKADRSGQKMVLGHAHQILRLDRQPVPLVFASRRGGRRRTGLFDHRDVGDYRVAAGLSAVLGGSHFRGQHSLGRAPQKIGGRRRVAGRGRRTVVIAARRTGRARRAIRARRQLSRGAAPSLYRAAVAPRRARRVALRRAAHQLGTHRGAAARQRANRARQRRNRGAPLGFNAPLRPRALRRRALRRQRLGRLRARRQRLELRAGAANSREAAGVSR